MLKKRPFSVSVKLRSRIYGMLSFFVLICLGIFVLSLRNDLDHIRNMADKENHETTLRVQESAYQYLEYIRNYYLSACKDSRVLWMLENNQTEKMCKEILDAASILAGNQLINDQIDQYALVNYSTKKILSKKGFFRVRELINSAEINQIYEEYKNRKNNGWLYLPDGTQSDTLSPDYRLTVDTAGMNLFLPLPMNSVRLKGMLLIQLDQKMFYNALAESLGSRQALILVDDQEKVLYATEEAWAESTLKAMDPSKGTSGVTISKDGVKRTAEEIVLPYFNWRVIVMTTVDPVSMIPGVRYILLLLLLGSSIAFLIAFFIFSYLRPMEKINELVEGEKINDLKGVAEHVRTLHDRQAVLSEKLREQTKSQKELDQRKLIHGEIPDAQIKSVFLPYKIFTGKNYLLLSMVIHRQNEEAKIDKALEKSLFIEMWETIGRRYSDNLKWHPIYVRSAFWTLVESDDRKELISKTNRFIRNLEDYFFETKKVYLNTGMSDIHQEASEFQEAMSECIYTMNRYAPKTSIESSHVLQYGQMMENSSEGMDHLIEMKITSVVAGGSQAEVQDLCSQYFAEIEKMNLSRDAQMNAIYLFVSKMTTSLMEAGLEADSMYGVSMTEVFHTLSELYDLVKIRRFIKYNLIETAWEKLGSITIEKNNSLLKQIEGLLEKTKGDITLSELSDELNVPPSMIWKALKMEEGKTFSEYQESYKLQRARKLLLETDLLISDIAMELNYTNAQNFIRFFSKAEGMTPGSYRKKYKK